ncbi:Glutamate-tRNA ligase (Glu-tRNA) [Candidatus Vidania fulgoroideae]|nr:Glutamate-tRNA ligase (Glu-tRNA) [Candidatus Vidania fulgoroideae]
MKIKTRFAPSPSGSLHLGNLRAALVPFIFANKNKGIFFLRIDNTNSIFFSKKNIRKIIDDLKDFKLKFNYKIFQSKRIRLYIKYSLILLRKKKAYLKNNAIYYKVEKEGEINFNDYIRKNIKVKKREIKDFVIIRSNGFSTFNFACAIDDFLEGVNFVFRGEEHINNTIKQIMILNSLNFKNIKYSHISNIVDNEGKKISKRKKSFSIRFLLHKGILRSAIVNYVCNLGFSNNDSVLTKLKEVIKKFDIKKLNFSQSKYDFDKILWYNKKHICKIKRIKIFNFLKKKIDSSFLFKDSISFLKSRSVLINDFYILYKKYLLSFLINKKTLNRRILVFFKKMNYFKWNKEDISSYIKKKRMYTDLNLFFFNKKKNVPSVIDVIQIVRKKILF